MSEVKLIVMSGLPGSGKSSVSAGIAKAMKVPVFSVDPIESAIIESGIKKSFKTGYAAYLAARTLADEQLKLGNTVIIDAVNAMEVAKNIWRKLAKKHSLKLIIIECMLTDPELHKKRIESRVRGLHGIPEVTWDDVGSRTKEYTTWDEPVLRLDSSKSLQSNIEEAMKFVQSK